SGGPGWMPDAWLQCAGESTADAETARVVTIPGALPPRRPGREPGGQRQVSSRAEVPEAGVVWLRLGSLSQVTVPSGFFLMYLNWKVVFGGRFTVARQIG